MPKLLASFKLIKPGVNCPGVNCPGVNRPGVNCPGVNRPGVYCPGVNCPPPGYTVIYHIIIITNMMHYVLYIYMSGWPSGLRRQTQDISCIHSNEHSGPLMWAWVQIPLLTLLMKFDLKIIRI